MNACREWNDRLFDYAVGELRLPEACAIEEHLKCCAACAAAVGELCARAEEINAALCQLVQGAQPPLGFHARVLAKLHARSAPVAWRLWQVGVLAAVMTSVLIVTVVLHPPLSKWRPVGERATPAPVTALSVWRSPTDGLLRSSGDELLRPGPRLGRFYFHLGPGQKVLPNRNGGNKDES